MLFRNRVEAGRKLAAKLQRLRPERPVVVALPRGGVPVAYEVASALGAPLDVLVARKVGAPGHPELGIGAVAEGGVAFFDDRTIETLHVGREHVDRIAAAERAELSRRVTAYRGNEPPLDVRGRMVILVDDGLATGVTARAAIRALRSNGAASIVFAAPVCAPQTARLLSEEADRVVCVSEPAELFAVGAWYADFSQTGDDEVIALLRRARRDDLERKRSADRVSEEPQTGKRLRTEEAPKSDDRAQGPVRAEPVSIDAGRVPLDGTLTIPDGADAVVIFAHGSGSSRFSPRNRYVAGELERAGLATLLVDLLSKGEEQLDQSTGELRFNIALLADRLLHVTDWVAERMPGAKLGYFGASTGAAAALVAAARQRDRIGAIVSRGGRPDLAGDALPLVHAPTLFIVGGADSEVLHLNLRALARMEAGMVKLEIVPGATHLFEEPGALVRVAGLSASWLSQHLREVRVPTAHAGRLT
jgi:putative phosphoribosyl transferase